MSFSVYDVCVPVLIRGFGILSGCIDLAESYAAETGIAPAVLVGARLFPDMLPFSGQVQRASNNAKNGVARLAGMEPPRFADTEASFPELRKRHMSIQQESEGRPSTRLMPPEAGGSVQSRHWTEIAASSRFQELLAVKRRTITLFLCASMGFYFLLMLLCGLARPAMVHKLIGSLGIGYVLIIGMYLICWLIAVAYVRIAGSVFDVQADAVAARLKSKRGVR